MPRKSSAALSVIPAVGRPNRLSPPANLSATERRLFTDIVASVSDGHFAPSDGVLLCRYVEAHALAERAASMLRENGEVDEQGKVSPWLTVSERANRVVVALATKLRLCPSTRIDPMAAHRRANRSVGRPSAYDLGIGGEE